MKKLFLLLFLFLIPLSLVSCGDDEVYEQVYEEFDPNKEYQIDFLGWGGIAEQKNFQEMISKFMEEYPNVKVFYNAISDTTTYSTNLVNNADSLPDVFYVPDWDYIKWVDSGRLLNLTPYLEESDIDKLWDMSIDIFRWDTKTKTVGTGEDIYGLPKDLGPYTIVYNKTLLTQLIEEYNLDVTLPSTTQPMSFTEFKEYLGNFKGLNVDGVKITPITHYEASCAVYSNNANYYTDDSATTQAIDEQNLIDAIQFVADLSKQGLASDYA
jgi:multiple sugar transport system substrate-binding protein